MTDAAGLHFVVSTPAQTLDKHDRKAIRSHATKAGVARRPVIQLGSWICPRGELEPLKMALPEKEPILKSIPSASIPERVGGYFPGLQLPSGVEPYMIQDLVKLIDLDNHGVYPYEICLDVHPVERGWFPYMISDVCCLHSMMFSARTLIDKASQNQPGRLACFHYAQTLQLLQARLNEFDRTSARSESAISESAISDSTIMVVITLAAAAELMGDLAATASHIKGLEKMVNLRGGVRALNTHNNLQVKVCRADLAYALSLGESPCLFREGISWDCFIADRGLIHCSHPPHGTHLRATAEPTMDLRLHNALRDLHAFSCISNLAYQTTRKLSPTTYNEALISILYRLTNLTFQSDPLQEAIRTGLLAFSSTIFMQRHFMQNPYDHLLNLFINALYRLYKFTNTDLPIPIALWLTLLSHVVANKEPSPSDLRNTWLDKAIQRAGIDSWPQAHEMLRSIVWVDFIHDRLGKRAFEAAMLRLERAPPSDNKCASGM